MPTSSNWKTKLRYGNSGNNGTLLFLTFFAAGRFFFFFHFFLSLLSFLLFSFLFFSFLFLFFSFLSFSFLFFSFLFFSLGGGTFSKKLRQVICVNLTRCFVAATLFWAGRPHRNWNIASLQPYSHWTCILWRLGNSGEASLCSRLQARHTALRIRSPAVSSLVDTRGLV